MDKEEFDFMEVKPKEKGFYFVTLFQFDKVFEEDNDYIRDWLRYDGQQWEYEEYTDCCYVCFVWEKAKTAFNI